MLMRLSHLSLDRLSVNDFQTEPGAFRLSLLDVSPIRVD